MNRQRKQKHGFSRKYYDDGGINLEGKFEGNRKVDEWIYYDKKGRVSKKEIYQNNKLIEEFKIIN